MEADQSPEVRLSGLGEKQKDLEVELDEARHANEDEVITSLQLCVPPGACSRMHARECTFFCHLVWSDDLLFSEFVLVK
jgi:hypothetical protein